MKTSFAPRHDDATTSNWLEWQELHGRPRLRIARTLRGMFSASDFAQQAYCEAMEPPNDFLRRSPRRSVQDWLRVVARNRHASALRKVMKERRAGSPTSGAASDLDGSQCAMEKRTVETPDQLVAREEARSRVREAIERLPGPYRAVIRMMDFELRSAKDVSRTLRRSVNAVYMLHSRARQALQSRLATLGICSVDT